MRPGSVRVGAARALRVGAGLAAALCATGCTDYLSRRDTLVLESGEAVQANMAVQIIDPSPPGSRRIGRDTDGARLQPGIERYRTPQAGFGGAGAEPAPRSAVPAAGNGLSR